MKSDLNPYKPIRSNSVMLKKKKKSKHYIQKRTAIIHISESQITSDRFTRKEISLL